MSDNIKIAILGAAGGIGQSLSLLCKTQLHPLLKNHPNRHIDLALYDVVEDAVNGVSVDLSHIDTPVTISNHSPQNGIKGALENTSIVIIPAGVPRKPGMTRDDLFNVNAGIISSLTDSIAQFCDLKKVFVLVISNPVNSLVPVMVNHILTKHANVSKGTGIEHRIMGITKLDAVRASTFLHGVNIESNTKSIENDSNVMPIVPVIGGHSGETIIPLFSQSPYFSTLSKNQLQTLIQRVQYGGDEVVKAKNGKGSATLCMAHAGFQCIFKLLPLILGDITEFVDTYYVSLKNKDNCGCCKGAKELRDLIDDCDYFAIPLTITASGCTEVHYDIMNKMNSMEKNDLLPISITQLKKNIDKGIVFSTTQKL